MHLTVFNVVPRLALIGDAGGAVGEDGAEFLSLPDTAPTLFLTLFFQSTLLIAVFSIAVTTVKNGGRDTGVCF